MNDRHEPLMTNDEIIAGQCPDCGSIECRKHELGVLRDDDEEGRLAWVDIISMCNSREVIRRRQQFIELRDAIAAWTVSPHWYDCGMFAKRGSFYLETACTCGVGEANAARAAARKAAGLED